MFHVPETYRIRIGPLATDQTAGQNGAFLVPPSGRNRPLSIIASDGLGWEHVSVKASQGKHTRIPTWLEMCVVKALFWDPEDCVMQLHPPQSQWVNNHESVLHLWRPADRDIPQPPAFLVGIKAVGPLNAPSTPCSRSKSHE